MVLHRKRYGFGRQNVTFYPAKGMVSQYETIPPIFQQVICKHFLSYFPYDFPGYVLISPHFARLIPLPFAAQEKLW